MRRNTGVPYSALRELDEEVQNYLSARADSKGIALSELINSLLRKDIELIETAKQGRNENARDSGRFWAPVQ
jgi:hypothetical protein